VQQPVALASEPLAIADNLMVDQKMSSADLMKVKQGDTLLHMPAWHFHLIFMVGIDTGHVINCPLLFWIL
jgi:purine-cytosine permease-like protein